MTTTTYYGFERANHVEEPAWFHTREAAERFNVACGSILGAIGESNNPDPADVLDTPEMPWRLSL